MELDLLENKTPPLSVTRRPRISYAGRLPKPKSVHEHLGFFWGFFWGGFVWVFLRGGILRWLLETRLRLARVAAKRQRLEGSRGVVGRAGL